MHEGKTNAVEAGGADGAGSSGAAARGDGRPLLAIVSGHLTPYRIALHKRIAAELPEVRLASLVTKYRTGPWVNPGVPEIGTVMLDPEPPPAREVANMTLDRGGRSRAAHVRHEIGTARRVWAWMEAHSPGAVLCGGYDELPVLSAMRWARRRGAAVFMSGDSNVHGDFAGGLKRAAKRAYVARIGRMCNEVLVCGSAGRAFFERYGVPEGKIRVMPLEIDYRLIETLSGQRVREVAESLGLDGGAGGSRRRIVVCCRLIAVKRVDLVIDAFKAIAAARPEWDLVIVGKGELQAELEARCGGLVSDGRVRFAGFLDGERVAAVYRSSHVLALASDYEPWGLVVNEACSAGMAVVVSDRVGAAYELVNSENGRMVRAGDVVGLTDALREVTDTSRLGAMQAASRGVIARWRRDHDPVQALRQALKAAGVV
ncbi:MAG: glycosyltransferase family 4 protein [Phycisphaerales bacterium]|nr:glycosyltransferase family 4 protein [Phycisphaerales bacterium]